MYKFKGLGVLMLTLVLTAAVTGCEQATEGSMAAKGSVNAEEMPQLGLESLDLDLDDLEKQLADAKAELESLNLVDVIAGRLEQSNFDRKINNGLKRFFEGVLSGVDKVDAKIADVRVKIMNHMAKLDPANPAHQRVREELQNLLGKLDRLEDQIDEALARMVQSIDKKVVELNEAASELDPKKASSWLAYIFWKKVRDTVIEYRDKMAAKM